MMCPWVSKGRLNQCVDGMDCPKCPSSLNVVWFLCLGSLVSVSVCCTVSVPPWIVACCLQAAHLEVAHIFSSWVTSRLLWSWSILLIVFQLPLLSTLTPLASSSIPKYLVVATYFESLWATWNSYLNSDLVCSSHAACSNSSRYWVLFLISDVGRVCIYHVSQRPLPVSQYSRSTN